MTKENLAEHIASRAGWRSYNVNFSNIIFDFIQASALLKGTGLTRSKVKSGKVKAKLADKRKTGLTEEAQKTASEQLEKIATSKLTKAANVTTALLRQSTEGLEEMINFIGEKEGKSLAQALLGEDDSTFSQRLLGYMKDPHLTEVAFWGALGGIAFEGIHTAFTGSTSKQIADAQLATITAREAETTQLITLIKDVKKQIGEGKLTVEEGKEKINDFKSSMGTNMGFTAATHQSTNVLLEQLENGLFKQDILNSMTTEELKEVGINDIDKAIAKTKSEVLAAEKYFNKYRGRVMALQIEGDKPENTRAAILQQVVRHQAGIDRISDKLVKSESDWKDISNANAQLDKVLAANPEMLHYWRKKAYEREAKANEILEKEKTTEGKKIAAKNAKRMKENALAKIKEIDELYPNLKDNENKDLEKSADKIMADLVKCFIKFRIR